MREFKRFTPDSLAKRHALTRFIYLVARPISKAGPFGFLSEGKLPLCHWGILVSEYDEKAFFELLDYQTATNQESLRLGMLFELAREESHDAKWQVNVVPNFGKQLPRIWKNVMVFHVGETIIANEDIISYGNI